MPDNRFVVVRFRGKWAVAERLSNGRGGSVRRPGLRSYADALHVWLRLEAEADSEPVQRREDTQRTNILRRKPRLFPR